MVIHHIALSLLQLKKAKMKLQSIKRLRKMAGWDNAILASIITKPELRLRSEVEQCLKRWFIGS